MFEQIRRIQSDANGQDVTIIKWHGTNQYQTILTADLRQLQADYNEFVPAGRALVTTLHADCADCDAAAHGAEAIARATGSVSATQVHDHRDGATGQLVIDHQATWARR